jgi:hypothetical protein
VPIKFLCKQSFLERNEIQPEGAVKRPPTGSLTMRDAGPVLLDPPAALQKIVTPM